MKTIVLFLALYTLHVSGFAQVNVALQGKIIKSSNMDTPEKIIDGKSSYNRECESNFSYFILDLQKACTTDSVNIIFGKGRECDNFIKKITVSTSLDGEDYCMLKVFGESNFTKILTTSFPATLMRYVKVEFHSLEDCRENEYLCIDEIEVFAQTSDL